ncbi:uncharacterized protein LOC143915230 [Arctopsyche grandis]|uniref:uncharacterized protein LOC143915230 n=1 Tax=Arctopsyche grandis TaxID=121162 RepID=UPI00406D63C0
MVMDFLNNNPAPLSVPASPGLITLANVKDDECFNYSLVLVKGNVPWRSEKTEDNKIYATVLYNSETTSSTWDVINGEFKCIFDLKRGKNHITLQYETDSRDLVFEYTPRRTNLRVTPVYIVCQGHDGRFQSPRDVDSSVESACSRIATGAKLIQCVMAEKLYELGMGRKTFQLEHEINPKKPECIVFRSNLNVNKARKMKESELWCHFGRELMLSDLGSNERKFMAFISCTRFKGMDNIDKVLTHEEIVSMTEGHAALGGGGLAVFGSACLYTWPTTFEQIIPKFLDTTIIDAKRFMDDSCYRGTIGGCFATTLGSVCHELGHTFDLGHTKDGIMGRGFDHFDRVFTAGDRRGLVYKDANLNFSGKPTQHTTVSLTRSINVTMNVGEPIRTLGPRSKTTLGNFISLNNDILRRGPNVTPINRLPFNATLSNKHDPKRNSIIRMSNDYTYWTKSCGVFLSYHRWFNNEYGREREAITRYLKFDKNKMMILSTAGIRVVEVREESTGMVIDSYEFTEPNPEKRFLIPFTSAAKNKILVIVVEDDLGNVLKQLFSY